MVKRVLICLVELLWRLMNLERLANRWESTSFYIRCSVMRFSKLRKFSQRPEVRFEGARISRDSKGLSSLTTSYFQGLSRIQNWDKSFCWLQNLQCRTNEGPEVSEEVESYEIREQENYDTSWVGLGLIQPSELSITSLWASSKGLRAPRKMDRVVVVVVE